MTSAKGLSGRVKKVESSEKQPNPIDISVGSRVRLRRVLMGMSQEKLGTLMDVTFQQIQKYEKGANRISASRLFELSKILNTPVQFFFEEVSRDRDEKIVGGFAEPNREAYVLDFLNSREGLELNRAFVRVTDPKVRKRIIDLIRSLNNDEPGL